MVTLAVDSNAVIAYREGISEVCQLMDNADILLMPVTVLGELIYGALNSIRPNDNEQIVRKFLSQCNLILIDEGIASRYAEIRLMLKRNGSPIPENDIWIAASCMETNAVLLSQDNHFKNIPDLKLIGWK